MARILLSVFYIYLGNYIQYRPLNEVRTIGYSEWTKKDKIARL